jgi:hypothetical protein
MINFLLCSNNIMINKYWKLIYKIIKQNEIKPQAFYRPKRHSSIDQQIGLPLLLPN